MPGEAETWQSVINEMTHGTDFQLVNSLHAKYPNLTQKDLNTGIEMPENSWNFNLVVCDSITSSGKLSGHSQLFYCSWGFGIFDGSHGYKTKNRVSCQITINVRIGFKLQVTAGPGLNSLHNWCIQMMLL
jgi:hypothetical protein